MIRLATAHAKLRCSKFVEESDAKVAFGVLNYALFSEDSNDNTGDEYIEQSMIKGKVKK